MFVSGDMKAEFVRDERLKVSHADLPGLGTL
jgi:hypothetical protein